MKPAFPLSCSGAFIYGVLCCLFLSFCCAEGFKAYPVNATMIIRSYGYPCENHEALTPDGWKLSLQRIPHGRRGPQPGGPKGLVLFQHGLTDCSAGVVLNNPKESLAFVLADAGYEVWLGNNRGNGYSMTNIHYHSSQSEFWDFSWDDMALYDFPTNIQYILDYQYRASQKQNPNPNPKIFKKLTYIGHSQGTIQAFAGLISNSSVADYLNLFVALAPVAYGAKMEGLLLRALAELDTATILELLGVNEFFLPVAIKKLLPDICIVSPELCQFSVDLVAGPTTFLNDSRLSYYLNYEPNPTSVKNMIHWSQAINSQNFQMYDYGIIGNIEHYGQFDPPTYDFKNFPPQLPVALFTGSNDYLADPQDVLELISKLPTPPYVHNEVEYAHLDPLLAPNAHIRIYPLILQLIQKYSSN